MDRNNSALAGGGVVDPLQVLQFWKDFDLDGRRVSLDKQVLLIVARNLYCYKSCI